MELTFSEKLAIQRGTKESLGKLKSGISDFMERLTLQRSIKESLNKLLGTATQIAKTIYERLIAGEFLNEIPEKFVLVLQDAYKEIQSVDKLRQPSLEYIEKHQGELHLVNAQTDTSVFESTTINLKSALESPEKFLQLFADLQKKIGNKEAFMTIRTSA